jgi:uncharacterized membrane protein
MTFARCLLSLCVFATFATPLASISQADELRTLSLGDQTQLTYSLHEGTNAHGEREMIIDHKEERRFAPDTSVTVLIARDLDGDGRYDAWFYMGNQGVMESLDLPATTDDGWETAQQVLKEHTRLENRWLAGIMLGSLASKLTFTESHKDHLMQKLAAQEIDLLDLGVHTDRIARQNPRAPELVEYYTTLSDGWADIADQAQIKGELLAALGDVTLVVGAAAVGKGLTALGPWLTRTVGETELATAAGELYTRFSAGISDRISQISEKLGIAKSMSKRVGGELLEEAGEAGGRMTLMKLALKDRLEAILSGLEARGRIGQLISTALQKTAVTSKSYYKTTIMRLPYVVETQGLQLVTESYDDRQQIFNSKNPIIVAHNVLSDKDLMQDMLYMTVDSFGTTAIIQENGNGLKAYAKAGVFSMVDSNAMNYFVKHDTDLKRNTLDTGWEVGIGNLQTVFDMHTLEYFEKMSAHTENPNLRLVGYAVTGLDQFLGYVAYGKATRALDKYEEKEAEEQKAKSGKTGVVLTPIFAPN